MGERPLTARETNLARRIFGNSIDYARVRIHSHKAYPFQPNDTAITPNGHIYFPSNVYQPDFSVRPDLAAWFIHEMVHVWQHQHGDWVRTKGMLFRTYKYGDITGTTRSFSSFLIEQQADIVSDYFRMTLGGKPTSGSGRIEDYRRIIPFLPKERR